MYMYMYMYIVVPPSQCFYISLFSLFNGSRAGPDVYIYTAHPVMIFFNVYMYVITQGGPGGSSTGFGNFEEIGPYDVYLNPRNTTWVQAANVLFVDNPVGTGYSYVDEDSAYTTNVDEIAQDLLTLFKAFLKTNTVFQVYTCMSVYMYT